MTVEEKRAHGRAYYQRHKEKIKARSKAYSQSEKGKEVQRIAQAKYRSTSKRKAVLQRYNLSSKGRAALRRSNRSAAGVARHKRWEATEAGQRSIKQRVKRSFLKRAYGLTEEQIQVLRAKQNGLCAICKRAPNRWHIDHNHATNRFRGLLCETCNVGLGMFKDSTDNLKAAIRYLERTPR